MNNRFQKVVTKNILLSSLLLAVPFVVFGQEVNPKAIPGAVLVHTEPDEEPVSGDTKVDSLAVSWEIKNISVEDFDTFLIPCTVMYDFAWDHLNVDINAFHPKELDSTGVALNLIEEDCGFHHPHLGEINSDFGWRHYRMHHGIDVDLNTGDTIYAAFDGVVRISKVDPYGYGNYVLIRHYNGLETLYGHLSERWVVPNQTIRAGDVLGLGGNTGRSTGPHLHFEVRYMGKSIDPKSVIDFDSGKLVSDTLVLQKQSFSHVFEAEARRYYRVRSGDNLWRISRRYGTTVGSLCRLNGISSRSVLRVGQVLRVY